MNKLSLRIVQEPLLDSFDFIISKLDNINNDEIYTSIMDEVLTISNNIIMIEAISEYKVLQDYIALLKKVKNKDNDNNLDIILLKKITKDFKKYLSEIVQEDEINELFLWYIWLNINESLKQDVIKIKELFYPIPEFENIQFVQFKKKNNEPPAVLKTIRSIVISRIKDWNRIVDVTNARKILIELHGLFEQLYKFNYSRICKAYWLALEGRIKMALLDPNLELDRKDELTSILEPVENEIDDFINKGKIRKIENLHNVIISLLEHDDFENIDENENEDLKIVFTSFNLRYFKKIMSLSENKEFMKKYSKLIENSNPIKSLFKELIYYWNSITKTSIYSDDICPILEKIIDNKTLFPSDDENIDKFFDVIKRLNDKYINEDQITIQDELMSSFANFILLFEKYSNLSYLMIEHWEENYHTEYNTLCKIINDEIIEIETVSNKVHDIDKIKYKKETFRAVYENLATRIDLLRQKLDYYKCKENNNDDYFEELNADSDYIENNQILENLFIMIDNPKLTKFFEEYFEIFKYMAGYGKLPEDLYKNALSYLGTLSVYLSIVNQDETLANEMLEHDYVNNSFDTFEQNIEINNEFIEKIQKEIINEENNNVGKTLENINEQDLLNENINENLEQEEHLITEELNGKNIQHEYKELSFDSEPNLEENHSEQQDILLTVSKLSDVFDDNNIDIQENTKNQDHTEELFIKNETLEEQAPNNVKEENNMVKQIDVNNDEMISVFLEEAMDSVIPSISEGLKNIQYENGDLKENMVIIRRGYHTLKGGAAQVGLTELSVIFKNLEERFNNLLLKDIEWTSYLTELVKESINFTKNTVSQIHNYNSYQLDSEEIEMLLDQEQMYREMGGEYEPEVKENVRADVSTIQTITNEITNNYINNKAELEKLLIDIQEDYKELSDKLIVTDKFVNNIKEISSKLDDDNYIDYYKIFIDKLENLANKKIDQNNIGKLFDIKPIILNTVYNLIDDNVDGLPELGDYSHELLESISDENISNLYDRVINKSDDKNYYSNENDTDNNNNNNDSHDNNNYEQDEYDKNQGNEFYNENSSENYIDIEKQLENEEEINNKIVLDSSLEIEFNENISNMEDSLDRMIEELRAFNKYFANIKNILDKKD